MIDPIQRPKKLFEDTVDRIRDQLGWVFIFFILKYNIVFFKDDASKVQFDSVCPQYYQFLPNINKWKQKVIPR